MIETDIFYWQDWGYWVIDHRSLTQKMIVYIVEDRYHLTILERIFRFIWIMITKIIIIIIYLKPNKYRDLLLRFSLLTNHWDRSEVSFDVEDFWFPFSRIHCLPNKIKSWFELLYLVLAVLHSAIANHFEMLFDIRSRIVRDQCRTTN